MIGGRYSLDREIGRGGMGSVWLGRDEVLGRAVAIKRVGAMPGGSSPDLVRAEREARIAARVNHPHVVAVFDLVHDGDQKWLVMEYVEGMTLADLIKAQVRLSSDEAAPILAQAAEALSAAHEAGVIHRDVKPSNILVTPEGLVKLSDFGIARAEADASLTATGLVTGSPAYIAPEVASGRMATGASDVWSLGATAFHALTGRPPYDVGDNVLGALYRIVHEEPPRLEEGSWLTPFVTAAMNRDPAQRCSMGEVSAFLRSGGRDLGPLPSRTVATSPEQPGNGDGGGGGGEHPTQMMMPPAYDGEPEPAVEEAPPSTRPLRRRLPVLPLVVGTCALVLVAMIGLLLLNNDPESDPGAEPSDPSSSADQSPDSGEPTAASMEAFVESYLTTVDQDPSAAFDLLTPAYQAESGGLPGYESFWGTVSNVRLESIEADPGDLIVNYTYSYNQQGSGSQTDTILMELARRGDSYLVANAETIA